MVRTDKSLTSKLYHMLTKNEEKLIKSLHRKKGRRESGLCLVEGQKVIDVAGAAIQKVFHPNDSEQFDKLVTTETPQNVAAIAQIPSATLEEVKTRNAIIILDGVQDPGNVGAIFRLCLAFDAAVISIESADPSSPKVIRSSVGAVFQVPWIDMPREGALKTLEKLDHTLVRLEKVEGAESVRTDKNHNQKVAIIAGSEGNGIQLPIEANSIYIPHSDALESLNVGNAIAIALYEMSQK